MSHRSNGQRHDYRYHWTVLTRRLSMARTAADIAAEVAGHLVAAGGGRSVAVYLAAAPDKGGYELGTSIGRAQFFPTFPGAAPLSSWLRRHPSPARLPRDIVASIMARPVATALGVPIRWQTTLLGLIVLESPHSGANLGAEDLQFLATVAQQAAASLVAVRLSEAHEQAQQVDTWPMIHDIKNSVAALSLLAQNAVRGFSDADFQRDAVRTLTRSVERMQRALSRLSSPAVPQRRDPLEPIDLRELILEATSPLTTGNVQLVRRLEPVTTLYGDREALLRVVENLTTNAAEAIAENGTVTVTLAEDGPHAVISVADTGCGMSEEYRTRHLFAPFRSTKEGGWGIGLYQTKQAVERQSGEIYVESVEGHGTTVTVRLPLRAEAEGPPLQTVP